ncbi:MAG: 4-hydroxy-3-methylbut-2-enyl diphosphate reductase, partial [Gammaproteobacteria bacterium]|nr:4-hydroxy-3-methylbut-2-enyl diphosphate reductase [Gammaproteobacteria bacterium]
LRREWLEGIECIGITAGASAPEILVNEVIAQLKEWGASVPEEGQGQREDVIFPLPKALQIHP